MRRVSKIRENTKNPQVEQYQTLSDKNHAAARELLREGDLVQASEKLWGAAALAVKRIAAERGLSWDKHGGLWSFVSVLSKGRKDGEIIRLFYSANALHRNFYENEMTRDMVDVAADDVNTRITKISVIV